MSGCCDPFSSEEDTPRCPSTGSRGRAVSRQTVEALVTDAGRRLLSAGEYRFCPDRDCDIVYFGRDKPAIGRADLSVPVWHKDPARSPICYCFGDSERSIATEVSVHGRSTAEVRIRAAIAAGACACGLRNPSGRCCLGNVAAVMKRRGWIAGELE
jgi:hypothetical protein